MARKSGCPFCNPKAIGVQTFYRAKNYLCVYDHKPLFPGHSMLVPRRHVESFVDLNYFEAKEFPFILKRLIRAILKTYKAKEYDVVLQNGINAGASIKHIHWHVIPRRKGDIEDPDGWYKKLRENELQKEPLPLNSIRKEAEKLAKAMRRRPRRPGMSRG